MTSGKKNKGSGRGEEPQTGCTMYALRQMVEKRLKVQCNMALGFVDLEKAFDTVPNPERW